VGGGGVAGAIAAGAALPLALPLLGTLLLGTRRRAISSVGGSRGALSGCGIGGGFWLRHWRRLQRRWRRRPALGGGGTGVRRRALAAGCWLPRHAHVDVRCWWWCLYLSKCLVFSFAPKARKKF
jgi:hypothetical protein